MMTKSDVTPSALPRQWWITPDIESQDGVPELLDLLARRKGQGFLDAIFRQTALDEATFASVYQAFKLRCLEEGINVIVEGTPELAQTLGASGVYIKSPLLMQLSARPLPRHSLVGAYCHNVDELKQAEKLQFDFVSLSPVKATQSHPGQTPLGWEAFSDLVAQVAIPVYALGGQSLSERATAIAAGGQGVMGIRFIY